MDGGRRKVVRREGEEGEMLEGSRSLELNINPWWFICCGSLQAPSAYRQLLAPVSWPWTWMWKAGLLPRVPRHELPWLGERQRRPGQVVDLAGMAVCVCVGRGVMGCYTYCITTTLGSQSCAGVTALRHTHGGQWGLTLSGCEVRRCWRGSRMEGWEGKLSQVQAVLLCIHKSTTFSDNIV